MRVAVYNALEQGRFVPGEVQAVTTYEQALQAWRSGVAGALLLPDTVPVPRGLVQSNFLFTRYLVLLTPRVITDYRAALMGKTLVASPEERECLAQLLLDNNVGQQSVTDIRLLTQEQYLEHTTCVDVYCTSVVVGSRFLSKLPFPFYVGGVVLKGRQTFTYDATRYPKALNLDAVTTSSVKVLLAR